MRLLYMFVTICFLTSCVPDPASLVGKPTIVLPQATVIPAITPPKKPIKTPFPSPTRAPTWTPESTATPGMLVLTPDPYIQYNINALRLRQYGLGTVEVLETMEKSGQFTRYLIRYPSDGLNIFGFVNVPVGKGPFPVIIGLHGYSSPSDYQILDYTTSIMDELAGQGYLVVHPNYRNYLPSDSGDTLFRTGYAVDVLNLIELIRQHAGKPGLFEYVDGNRIGLWSHSMGGSIALKVAVITPHINAVLIYSGMSGDERKNSLFFSNLTGSNENLVELSTDPVIFATISPESFYKSISAPIQIHHGTADSVIPIDWAIDNCEKLKDASVKVECFYYDGADHTFRSRYMGEYSPRVTQFFRDNLFK